MPCTQLLFDQPDAEIHTHPKFQTFWNLGRPSFPKFLISTGEVLHLRARFLALSRKGEEEPWARSLEKVFGSYEKAL